MRLLFIIHISGLIMVGCNKPTVAMDPGTRLTSASAPNLNSMFSR
jgi:hypothetical protein